MEDIVARAIRIRDLRAQLLRSHRAFLRRRDVDSSHIENLAKIAHVVYSFVGVARVLRPYGVKLRDILVGSPLPLLDKIAIYRVLNHINSATTVIDFMLNSRLTRADAAYIDNYRRFGVEDHTRLRYSVRGNMVMTREAYNYFARRGYILAPILNHAYGDRTSPITACVKYDPELDRFAAPPILLPPFVESRACHLAGSCHDAYAMYSATPLDLFEPSFSDYNVPPIIHNSHPQVYDNVVAICRKPVSPMMYSIAYSVDVQTYERIKQDPHIGTGSFLPAYAPREWWVEHNGDFDHNQSSIALRARIRRAINEVADSGDNSIISIVGASLSLRMHSFELILEELTLFYRHCIRGLATTVAHQWFESIGAPGGLLYHRFAMDLALCAPSFFVWVRNVSTHSTTPRDNGCQPQRIRLRSDCRADLSSPDG